ncbi:hypothetical protein predicted by Glimmer/Critica [Acetobacter ghanensis]|uniref:Uncharacterized protein n=1 Tax=Acetobacter ghanensis TaxID=431306 RepID=A0A0U4YD04_9PROT|nr:hypothetical protein predicted by Glimmer/Critica [Acetobacter ghanensis]
MALWDYLLIQHETAGASVGIRQIDCVLNTTES